MFSSDPTPPIKRFPLSNTYAIYIDSYHASDTIFINDLARSLTTWHSLGRTGIVLQNPDEAIQRFVESKALDYPIRSEAQRSELAEDIERIVVEANKRIVAQLTESGVAAVGISGADRGTIERDGSTGQIGIRSEWLRSVAQPGVIPVLAPLANEAGATRSVSPGEVLNALIRESGWDVIVFPRNGQFSASSEFRLASDSQNGQDYFYDFDEIGRISHGGRLFLTHPKGLKMAEMEGKWMSRANFE